MSHMGPRPPPHPQFILTLSCGDRPGIVGAVASFLADNGCNIIDSAQFGDIDTGRFMMRVMFERLEGAPERAPLAEAFAAIAERFAMRWALHDATGRPRVLIMVSRLDHCLNDLLYRYRIGALPMDPVAIVSNHRDTYQLAASYNVPFFQRVLVITVDGGRGNHNVFTFVFTMCPTNVCDGQLHKIQLEHGRRAPDALDTVRNT